MESLETPKGRTRRQSKLIALNKIATQEEDTSNADEDGEEEWNVGNESEPLYKARVLVTDDVKGQLIYGFKTPKRKEALSKAAQNSMQSAGKSLKKNATKSILTAIQPKQREQDSGIVTDSVRPERSAASHIHAVHSLSHQINDSEEEESESENEDDEDGTKKEMSEINENRDLLDIYFEMHNSKHKTVTSDRTLSKLSNPKMQHEELRRHLEECQSTHIQEMMRMHSALVRYFEKWMFQMLCGFNILLYGFGSKARLLRDFKEAHMKNVAHLVVNGFFPGVTVKQILSTITEDYLEKDVTFKTIVEHSSYIRSHFDSDETDSFFLIVHNLDGTMLRSVNTQTALSQLAAAKHIHVIASIDHINAPLIWDQNRSSAFNWLWYDVTTFEPYSQETSYENSLMVQQSGTLALSSLAHVLRSLTPNARGIFRLLVDYQLDNKDNANYHGYSINDLYTRCREMFLVNSDLTLRAQLTEFKDHKLVKSKKGSDGVEYLTVAVDDTTLKQFLENEQ